MNNRYSMFPSSARQLTRQTIENGWMEGEQARHAIDIRVAAKYKYSGCIE